MSSSVNKVIIIGNVGKDPESRYMPNGDAVTTISVATSESWKDKNTGEQKESTEWNRVVFFRKLAEVANEYLKKGSQVYIEGRLRTRKWQGQDGQDRYTTEIHADEMKMLGKREGMGGPASDSPRESGARGSQESAPKKPAAQPAAGGNFNDFDDDIPF